MPELKNAHNEPLDLSLAQIVQLGKTKQRQLHMQRKDATKQQTRASSLGAVTTVMRRPVEVSETNNEEEPFQTNLTLAAIPDRLRNDRSSS